MRKLTTTVMTLLLAAGVQAAEVGGLELDNKVTVGGQDLLLSGAGIQTRVIFKVYVGSLYVPAKTNNLASVLAKEPRRIQQPCPTWCEPERRACFQRGMSL